MIEPTILYYLFQMEVNKKTKKTHSQVKSSSL